MVAWGVAVQSSADETVSITPRGDVGRYSVEEWKQDWPNCEYEDGVKERHVSVVSRGDEKRFRVDYAVGEIGPEKGGAGWRFPIEKRSSATLSYVLRFSPEFDWVKGGKLPGLSGGPESVTGGNPANGTNGFSCRLMWRKDGRGEAYVYHVNQNGNYGDSFKFPEDFRFRKDLDISVRMSIEMNTPGRKDGKLRVHIRPQPGSERRLVVDRDNIEWRTTMDFAVDSIQFETFHGGGNKSWAPSRSCFTEFAAISLTGVDW